MLPRHLQSANRIRGSFDFVQNPELACLGEPIADAEGAEREFTEDGGFRTVNIKYSMLMAADA